MPADPFDSTDPFDFPEEFEGGLSPSADPSNQYGGLQETETGRDQGLRPGQPPDPLESSAGFGANLKAGIVDDPDTKIRILAEEIFPGDPEAVKRFGVVNNEIVYMDNNRKLQTVDDSVLGKLGKAAAFLPETVLGTVGATLGGPVGAGLGAAAGRAGKKIVGALGFDEPQDVATNAQDIGVEFGLGAVGEGVARGLTGKGGIVGGLNKNTVRDIDRLNVPAAKALQRRIKTRTGIDVDLAQASNLTSIKQLKKWALKFPNEASDVLEANDLLQQGQAAEAVERVMDTLSKQSSLSAQGVAGINAAQAVIESAKSQRSAAVQPLYERAFKTLAEANPQVALDTITDKMTKAKGTRLSALTKARRLLTKAEKGADGKTIRVPETDIEALHNAKLEIDLMLSKDPKHSAARTSHRDLTQIKDELVSALADASPEYDQARQLFAQISRDTVNPLEEGVIGIVSKFPNRSAAKLAGEFFSNANMDPHTVRAAKILIEKQPGGKEAWSGLQRQWLATNLEKASKITQSGRVTNLAGKFRQAVAGTPRQRAKFEAALNPAQVGAFDDLMEAFETLSRTPTGGSDTAFNQLTTQGIANQIGGVRRALQNPIDTIIGAFGRNEQEFIERNATAIADGLLDFNKVSQIRQLRKLPPGQEKAIQVLSIFGFVGGADVLQGLAEPTPDQLPQG